MVGISLWTILVILVGASTRTAVHYTPRWLIILLVINGPFLLVAQVNHTPAGEANNGPIARFYNELHFPLGLPSGLLSQCSCQSSQQGLAHRLIMGQR